MVIISTKDLVRAGGLTRIFLFGLSLVFCQGVLGQEKSKPSFDVYRTNQLSTEEIDKKFGSKIAEIPGLVKQLISGTAKEGTDKKIDQVMLEIISGIHKMGDFAMVQVVPIAYAENGDVQR